MLDVLLASLLTLQSSPPPTITLDRDNIEIAESCVIQIGANPIVDADNNGVIHISHEGITVDFNGQPLHGAKSDQTPDTFAGIGVKITARDVVIKNAKVSGYKVGIHAINADGLTIHNCDVSNNFHQRLKSTPQAENGSDWLWPHNNDNNEWMTNYGAGICVEDSNNVTLHDIRARKTQNGIILDRVNDSKVYDCDCSFLSGWGLAMWRSSKNVISRNAFDFCVRGYSHGVYNRGQDSAGILMFEQCCRNVIAENSCTHCGDGVFGFAGKEALGEVNPHPDKNWYTKRGCNENTFVDNDLSYAPAHGLEMTFSFSNQIWGNKFSGNAICGIWGGYSQHTEICENNFSRNGEMAYGLERGGVNIEHGQSNWIRANVFTNNACGIHLWSDEDAGIVSSLWAQANGFESTRNWIAENKFDSDRVGIHLQHSHRTTGFLNTFANVHEEINADAVSTDTLNLRAGGSIAYNNKPEIEVIGSAQPVDQRGHLAGRENIIMTEWGPWDHESPLLRFVRRHDGADEYVLLGVQRMPDVQEIGTEGAVFAEIHNDTIRIAPDEVETVLPYRMWVEVDGQRLEASGLLASANWEVRTFPSAIDPREDSDRWRREGNTSPQAHVSSLPDLKLLFGSGGMAEARKLAVPLPRDHFGVIASTGLLFPPGSWRLQTTSDDGIRVWMNDKLVIDDWTHHGPMRRDHEFTLQEATAIDVRVEYFELDGYAVLAVDFEQVDNR